jgi:hypothetical protein
VRPAEAHRHAEALRRAHGDVGSELSRRTQQREGQQIGGRHQESSRGVYPARQSLVVDDAAVRCRILDDDAERTEGEQVRRPRIAHVDVDPERRGTRANHGDGLGMTVLGDEEDALARARCRMAHVHRLRRGGGLVEERGVGERESGEVGDHRLVVEQRLETSLRDLRLVGRVRGVPGGVLEDVALHDRRRDGAVITHSDEGAEDLVSLREGTQLVEELVLALRLGQPQGGPADARGNGLFDESVEGIEAESAQHLGCFRRVRADVPAQEEVDGREKLLHVGPAGLGRRLAHFPCPSRNAWYAAASMRPATSPAEARRTTSIQPLP